MLEGLAAGLPVPPLAFWLVTLLIGLTVLVKASDFFTGAAETVGLKLGFSPFVVGATIVAIGTSLPELIASIIAVLDGASEIVAGNVVGSNIANLFVILGLAAIIDGHVRIKQRIAIVDLPFLLGSTLLLSLLLWNGHINRLDALLLLAALGVYMHYVLTTQDQRVEDSESREASLIKPILILIGSGFLIFVGAKATIDSVVATAGIMSIGSEVIAASAVAFGTSLPEVSVTIAAVRRGQAEMAVGNVLGSNVFNSLAVTGISALVGPLVVPASLIAFAVPVMLAATILVYFIIMQQEITRWEGWLLLLFYIYFVGALFGFL